MWRDGHHPCVLNANLFTEQRHFLLKLIDAGKRMEAVITRLGLKKTQSQAGITYSVLDLSWQSDLDAAAAASMREVSDEFRQRISDFDAFAATGE